MGCILVGSGAIGFSDSYSDIDIVVVVDDDMDTNEVSEVWKNYLQDNLAVMAYAVAPRADRIILHNFYLTSYLEINNCVLPLELLSATKERYKVLWDRTGRMQTILDESWAHLKTRNHFERYFEARKAGIWHYINHAYVALQRGNAWQAISDIEEIRNQIVHLRAYRSGLEPKRNRDVGKMEHNFLEQLSTLLVDSLSLETLRVKLELGARMFFQETKDACVDRNWEYDLEVLENAMLNRVCGRSGNTVVE